MNLYESTNELDEDKANCIGYMICKRHGIDVSIDNLDKLSSKYANMEKQDIAYDLTSMKEVAHEMNYRMGQYLDEKRKESKNKEQER